MCVHTNQFVSSKQFIILTLYPFTAMHGNPYSDTRTSSKNIIRRKPSVRSRAVSVKGNFLRQSMSRVSNYLFALRNNCISPMCYHYRCHCVFVWTDQLSSKQAHHQMNYQQLNPWHSDIPTHHHTIIIHYIHSDHITIVKYLCTYIFT